MRGRAAELAEVAHGDGGGGELPAAAARVGRGLSAGSVRT